MTDTIRPSAPETPTPVDRFRALPVTDRIETLREKMLAEPRGVSVEQALLITEAYDEHPHDPVIVKRAHALAKALERMEIAIRPEELVEEAERRMATATGAQADFHRAVSITMRGVRTFLRRYRDLVLAEADRARAESESTREDMAQVARNLDALAGRPPRTFHEAVQAVWILFTVLHMESNASSFSPGRLDVALQPFYENDIAAGRLDEARALEIVECLWLKFNQIVYLRNAHSAKYFAGFPIGFNIALGGQDAEGRDIANDMSYLFLAAQAHLGLPQPNLSV